jgi:hypothetical protein
MSNHYVAINRGRDGFKISDFTLGASSSASSDFELRVADLDAQSHTPTRKDIVISLKAMIRLIESGAIFTTFPPL